MSILDDSSSTLAESTPRLPASDLAEATRAALATEAGPIRADLAQLRGLLQNAMGQLQRSFFGLDAQFQEQSSHVQLLFAAFDDAQSALQTQLAETNEAIHEMKRAVKGISGNDPTFSIPVNSNVANMLEQLSNLDALTCERLRQLEKLSTQVRENFDGAIRALQFEDMATQLIDCNLRRVDRLDVVVSSLAQIVREFDGKAEDSAQGERLRDLLALVRDQSTSALRSPVAQESVGDGGGVEFF
jgi:methyl-accepting chemotaxis protein